MGKKLAQLIEESIKLELNVADLYMIFSKAFPEDHDFWQELHLEENRHADLIKTAKDIRLPGYGFPHKLLASSLKELRKANNKILSLLRKYKKNPPSRELAFEVAVSVEESAGELHFQRTMDKLPDSGIMKILQELNADEKDHAKRIRAYRESQGYST